jgi:hypothetical protein
MGLIKILKRQPRESTDESVPSAIAVNGNETTPEDREAVYLEAKARIFDTAKSTGSIPVDASNGSKDEYQNRKAEYYFRESDITDPE